MSIGGLADNYVQHAFPRTFFLNTLQNKEKKVVEASFSDVVAVAIRPTKVLQVLFITDIESFFGVPQYTGKNALYLRREKLIIWKTVVLCLCYIAKAVDRVMKDVRCCSMVFGCMFMLLNGYT